MLFTRLDRNDRAPSHLHGPPSTCVLSPIISMANRYYIDVTFIQGPTSMRSIAHSKVGSQFRLHAFLRVNADELGREESWLEQE